MSNACAKHQIPENCGLAPDIHELIQGIGRERLTCLECKLLVNCAEAERRLTTGERPKCSTGIHGFITRGYGRLDDNGFWEFPLPDGEQVDYFPVPHDVDGCDDPSCIACNGL